MQNNLSSKSRNHAMGQESEGVNLPLFIRTVHATFTAHGSSPKCSATCHHVSFGEPFRISPRKLHVTNPLPIGVI